MTRSPITPSIIIGGAAFLSFVLSVSLWFTDNRDEGLFVGLWVPSILAAGAFLLLTLDRHARKG